MTAFGAVAAAGMAAHRSATAVSPTPPVTSGLQLWFEADTEAPADGQPVTSWTDKSGFGRNLTARGGVSATMRRNAVNGRAAVEFDGSTSLLKTYASTFTIAQPDTFFIVYRSLDANTNTRAFVFDSRNSNVRQVFGRPAQGQERMYANVDMDAGGVTYPFSGFQLWSGTFSGGSSTMYGQGSLVLRGNAGNSGMSGLTLGGLSTSGQYGYDYAHVQVAELLVYSGALTTSQSTAISSWLDQKYAVLPPATPPSNTAPPAVSGQANQGSSLSASTGTWSGSTPMSFAYQWQRCDSQGANCADLVGATASSYTLGSSDVGSTVRVVVTASNNAGSAATPSAATAVVGAAAPVNTAPPVVSGTPTEGQTLRTSTGSWTGSGTITYAFQWRRCDASGGNCVAVGTGQSYTLVASDVGSTIESAVTATNSGGSTTAVSSPTATVASASSAPPPPVTAGLQLWYDASQEGNADGAPVTRWADHSGFARDLTSFDPGSAAVFRRNVVNGRAAVEFDGSASLLKTYGSTFTIGQPDTFFIVYRSLDPNTSNRAFVFDSTDPNNRQVFGKPGLGQARMYANVDMDAGGVTYPFSGFELWSGTFNGGSSTMYRQGSLLLQGNAGAAPISGFTLGALSTSGQYGYDYAHVQVAEVLVYSGALSASARASVTSWLDQKYAVLPAATPPSNTAPPAISGRTYDGATLSASTGTWSGSTPMTFAYQWQRCDGSGGNCIDLAGATASSYTLGTSDVGSTVRVVVTATNNVGNGSAPSAPSAVIASAPAVPQPPVTAGLQLWYDASQESYADGAPVTRWADHSAFGRDLTSFDAGSAAIFRANAVNGKPAIEFDGSSSLLKTYGSSFTIAQPDTFFIVYRSLDAAEGYVFDSTSSAQRQLLGRDSSSGIEMYADINLGVPNYTFPFPSFQLWSGTFNGGSSTLSENGVLQAQGSAGSSPLQGLTVGALSTSGQYGYLYSHSLVAEILWYSGALTATQQQQVTSWLKSKYAIP